MDCMAFGLTRRVSTVTPVLDMLDLLMGIRNSAVAVKGEFSRLVETKLIYDPRARNATPFTIIYTL